VALDARGVEDTGDLAIGADKDGHALHPHELYAEHLFQLPDAVGFDCLALGVGG
jgi:hypothetical protein